MPVKPLDHRQLYRESRIDGLAFEDTDGLADLDGALGQDRAVDAIEFGSRIDQKGYNLFVLGESGTGRHSIIGAMLRAKAASEAPPDEWAYVNNFAIPHRPRALRLPAGRGASFKEAMRRLADDIRTIIPVTFESDEYRQRRRTIDQTFIERQNQAFEGLRARAEHKNVTLVRTVMGFGLAPVRNGEVIKPADFAKLPQQEREAIEADIVELQKELEDIVAKAPRWDKERRDELRSLNQEITAYAVAHPIDELKRGFADLPEVVEHLESARADLIENVHMLLGVEQSAGQRSGDGENVPLPMPLAINALQRYEVNLLKLDGDSRGAPVIFLDNPTLGNLVGRIEHKAQFGALVTDFTLIKAGALHHANGGYLVMDALKVLSLPFAWDSLKRALRAGHVEIETPEQLLSVISTVSLQPTPIPLRIKVVLYGTREIYFLLSTLDPEFAELFKVTVDFDDEMARTDASEARFAQLIATLARREKMPPFARAAVSRIIERAARLADDAEKMSIRIGVIVDLMRESAWLARQQGAARVDRTHVQMALDAQIRRLDRVRERTQEAIVRDILLIDTDGKKIGQINGLSVLQMGNFAFGRPSRISAKVRLGGGTVIDIEREVKLGGPLHSKGVLILSGFLGARFAAERPLSLSASLVFEQSYGGVEGDSASSAELYALLSAIGEIALDQSLAVTGSVNQFGEVQAIGGVNEKIEGFFDICRQRGLTGRQGVIIPRANVKHLMLRQDVLDAARADKFRIFAVATIDEGMELLSGLPAGERDAGGAFPPGTVNRAIEDRLARFAEARKRFGREGDREERSREQ